MSLFGYFDLGLRAMSAARLSLQVAGDNISNAQTPGYVRRRLDLQPGFPVRVQGGLLDQGVEVADIRRMEDRFLQASLQREQGELGRSSQQLRGLQDVQSIFGSLDGPGLSADYAAFASSFDQLAAQPESLPLRRTAVAAADRLARTIRETYEKLRENRRTQDQAVQVTVERVNTLAGKLAELNQQISEQEADGTTAAPLRDQRTRIVEELVELTGGTAITGPSGRVSFAFAGGPTLVTGDDRAATVSLPLRTVRDADGMLRLRAGGDGVDVTDRLRDGRLGGMLAVRDDVIPSYLKTLDALAFDLTTRANAATTSAFDLNGAAGIALFLPDPPSASGSAASIRVNAALLDDSRLLAVSATGAAGDGAAAVTIARIRDQVSASLDGKSPVLYLGDSLARLGNDVASEDVSSSVSGGLIQELRTRRDSISGVSLDEEAVELMRSQKTFEAAAQFLKTLSDVTEIAMQILR